MTWFKVDDKFHSHRKVIELGKNVDALALWVVAGSWSADHLTDGFIPESVLYRLLPVSKARAKRMAQALESVRLWVRVEFNPDSICAQDGANPDPDWTQTDSGLNSVLESGWQFHGWNERGRQPRSEQVIADREANAARVEAFRERDRAKRNAITNGVTNGVGNEAPTRPDPTNRDDSLRSSSPAHKRASTGRGTRIPDDFAITDEMRAWGRDNFPGINGEAVTAEFIDYWRGVPGQRGVRVDWIATWRNSVRRAAERQPATNGHAIARTNGHAPSPRISATDRAIAEVRAAKEIAKAQIYGTTT